MKQLLKPMALAAALAVAACGGSAGPQDQLRQIDEKLARNIPMTEQQKKQVEQFRSEGERLLAENKADEAARALDQALQVLQRAEDAATFNKAE